MEEIDAQIVREQERERVMKRGAEVERERGRAQIRGNCLFLIK